jgi:hypothetical protein
MGRQIVKNACDQRHIRGIVLLIKLLNAIINFLDVFVQRFQTHQNVDNLPFFHPIKATELYLNADAKIE